MPQAPVSNHDDHSELLGTESQEIQLTSQNYAKGFINDNKESLLILFDSGATSSLISESCVQRSPYLKGCQMTETQPRRFQIGNGEYLNTNKKISFQVIIQGCKLMIEACIVDYLTGPDVLLGNSTLAALNGSLDFRSHVITIKPRKIWFVPIKGHIVKAGQSTEVLVKGKVPSMLKNAEVLLQPVTSVNRYVPSNMLVKLRKRTCQIKFTNLGKKPINLYPNKPVAFTDLGDFVHTVRPVPDEYLPSQLRYEDDIQIENLQKYQHLTPSDPLSRKTPADILKESIDLDSPDCVLSEKSKSRVRDMLLDHKEAFSLYGEVGHCSRITPVDIQLKDTSPFYIRPYPIPDSQKPLMDREIQKLVNLGILKKGCSAYSSPCLLIKKPNTADEWRFVSDFRFLNTRVITAQQNYLSFQNVLQKVGKSESKVLSVIDLKSAFHALPLSSRSQPYTGICPYPGAPMYMYRRLPMGMNLSPARWQQQINEILGEIPGVQDFCVAIHDDCLIFSRNEQEAMKHIEIILDTFQKHGLKLSPKKCRLFRRRCTYIGHEISISEAEGIVKVTAMSDKCQAIRNMRRPSNPKEVRRLIGAVTFLSMYLPKLQIILQPLHALTKKNQKFVWTEQHENAFQQIRELLISPPVLCAPQGSGDFHLYSDTSRHCTGSVLMQDIGGQQRVIGYYSKILPKAALRYSVTELELTGLLINCTAWKFYLQSNRFHAYVDHSSLVHMFKSKHQPPTLRLQKLIERLHQYYFDITYCKGSDMVISDFLSRSPREDDDELERIMPIALPVQLEQLCQAYPHQAAQVERPVTRAYARQNALPIPPLFPEGRQVDVVDENQPAAPPIDQNAAPAVPVEEPQAHDPEDLINDRPPDIADVQAQPQARRPLIPGVLRLQPAQPRPAVRRPQIVEPCLVDQVFRKKTRNEQNEDVSDSECPEFLLKPEPLVGKIEQLTAKHIPNQAELNRILKIIKRKVIRDYHLPFEAQRFKAAQQSSPHLKPIYDYLKHNIVPSDKKAARVIMLRSEQYLLCNDILFRLILHPNSPNFSFQLVIPDQFIDALIEKYHDSLVSNHQGCVRTYLTMRKLFFFHNMFDRIVSYIRSCGRCQEFKEKTDNLRPFHERIPLTYSPFQTISLDFKQMVKSKAGYTWLMVTTCAISRFTVCTPLKTLDAPAISEALIQRVFCSFGIPETLVTDAQSSLIGKVMEIVCNALKISQKVVSVKNHGSLQVERQIRSIADLIKINLDQYGEDWVQYHSVAQYSFNSFSSPQLGGYSPYFLVFYREPRDISGLEFRPLLGLTSSQSEYLQQLQERFDSVSKSMLQLQEKQQKTQNEKISQRLSKSPTYEKGQLVYLHKPSSSSLTSNAKKFTARYVGPFAVHEVLDPTHVLLIDLKGRILRDVFSVNRIKPAFMRTTESRSITNLEKLREALKENELKSQESQCHMSQEETKFEFIDETGEKIHSNVDDFVFAAMAQPVDVTSHQQNLVKNNGLAAPVPLSKDQQCRLLERLQKAPSKDEGYSVDKAKFQTGQLRLLLSLPIEHSKEGKCTKNHKFWWDPLCDQNGHQIVEKVLGKDSKVKCLGSLEKFTKSIYGMLGV